MKVSLTTMSDNGQIVIPADIRKESNIKPKTKFLVFNQGNKILLQQIEEKKLAEKMDLFGRLEKSERQFKKGKYTKANTKMSFREIDELLMGN